MELTIWIVSEGSPGHVSQSKGLAEGMASLVPARIYEVEMEKKGFGGLRRIYRILFEYIPKFRRFWIKLYVRHKTFPTEIPDIVIASGGKSVFFARYLADRFSSFLVYCGTPSLYPVSWFDCILSIEKKTGQTGKWIHTDVLLNPITPEIVREAAVEFPIKGFVNVPEKPKIAAVLVGGRSRSQHFSKDDWGAFGTQLNLLSEQEGWYWLVATSRRTGVEAENILRLVLDPKYIIDAVWWSKNPRKTIRAYLGHAQTVLVGCDSMTMVSEAVCSGRSVIVYEPKNREPSQYIDGFLKNLEEKGLVLCSSCQDIRNVFSLSDKLKPLIDSPVQTYARMVLDELNIEVTEEKNLKG